jgi:hypothetical protein
MMLAATAQFTSPAAAELDILADYWPDCQLFVGTASVERLQQRAFAFVAADKSESSRLKPLRPSCAAQSDSHA